jgi:microcystin-dependent protein
MAQPFVGEIRMFGGNFAPAGWAFCDGQLLSIAENDVLFQLIGTTYGGNGTSNFGLPDLRGRFPIHQGQGSGTSNRVLGEKGGVESVTLTTQQLGGHNHAWQASQNPGTSSNPAGQVLALGPNVQLYLEDDPTIALDGSVIQPTGGSQPHENLMPYLAISFILSLFGIFPSQT